MINFLSFLPQITTFAAFGAGQDCDDQLLAENQHNRFFGFPHWWKYIKNGETDALGNCAPKVKFPDELLAIGFAVVEMMLYAAGILAIVFIIVGGVAYMASDGNPEKAASARKRILNAVTGLVIVLVAVALVSFIGHRVS